MRTSGVINHPSRA